MITFVRTRHVYQSYTDFWKLVELSGFPTIYVDELDISQYGVFIVCPMNGEWRPHINNQHKEGKAVNAHLIHWNLERPSGSAGIVGEYAKQNRYLQYGKWPNGKNINEDGEQSYGRFIDEVWHSDRRLAQETEQKFVVLGSNSNLAEYEQTEKEYSFCHMSYATNRRQSIYKHFDNIGPNSWDDERNEVLLKSKFALNIHQDNHPYQEPLRFALFAAYKVPILSETIYDSYPFSDEFMLYADYDDLQRRMNEILGDDYSKYQAMAERTYKRMCFEFNFKKMVELAVNETVGWR